MKMNRFIREAKGGFYTPAFLTLNIDSSDNLELLMSAEGVSERTEALFLHEYIHLLQDVTTISGLVNIAVVVDYMKWATNIIKQGQLDVPCIPKIEDGYNLLPNAQLKKICTGDGSLKDRFGNQIKWQETLNLELQKDGTIINGEKITSDLRLVISIKATDGNVYSYSVGEHCISETMAYLIENRIYNDVIESPYDFPYRVINYVCEYVIPGFTNDTLNVIALCDACMIHSFPGRALYYGLQILKKYENLTAKQIYNIITSPQMLEQTGVGKGVTLEQLLARRKSDAIAQMSGYFTANYDSMIKWITQMIEAAFEIRSNNPYFMIDIANGRDIRNNKMFIDALNEIGCPVIMNNENNMVYIRNNKIDYDVHPPIFNVISQIYSILSKSTLQHNTYRCQLIEWCKRDFEKNNNKDLTSEGDKCRCAPWERTSPEELFQCYFGQLWYTWGLKDVIPKNE